MFYMAVYPITCYFNTGLSIDTAMDSLSLVKSTFASKAYESVWLLQDRTLGRVKINAKYDDIKNCDYCIIGSTGYHVLGVAMLNENVSQLDLSCDYLTTVGIANIEVIDGWCLRRSPTDDTLFSNEIPEPFQPTEPLELEISAKPVDSGTRATSDYKIVISTVQLDTAEYTADKYTDETQTAFVMVPRIPYVALPTVFSIGTGDDRKQYELPVGAAYNYALDIVKRGVQAVRSLGIDSCITASYTIPAPYVALGSDTVGRHEEIAGVDTDRDSNITIKYRNAVNNKVFSGQFMKIGLASIVTGASQEYDPADIVNGDKIEWRVMADPLPTGKPYAMPAYYKKSYNTRLYGSVAGGEWQKNTIEFLQPSGATLEYTKSQRSISANIVKGGAAIGAALAAALPVVGSSVASVPVVGKGAAAVGGAISGKVPEVAASGLLALGSGTIDRMGRAAEKALNDLSEKKLREIQFRAPDIAFSPVASMQNFFGNTFIEYRIRLSDNDTDRFDKFLTANGYAVSEPLKKEFFSTHVNFNFITADTVRVRTGYGLTFDSAVGVALQNGVRIWHKAPSQERLYNNPIGG